MCQQDITIVNTHCAEMPTLLLLRRWTLTETLPSGPTSLMTKATSLKSTPMHGFLMRYTIQDMPAVMLMLKPPYNAFIPSPRHWLHAMQRQCEQQA